MLRVVAPAMPRPHHSARHAGLVYGTGAEPGITRRRSGAGFVYRMPNGRPVAQAMRKRIDSLAIPPAWTDVWIAVNPRLHLQATGRDARGRKQYRYHPHWSSVRDDAKYSHMLDFGRRLPRIRARVLVDLRSRPLSRPWVLATVVRLLDSAMLRIGNREYEKHNCSYGLTTLRDRHVKVARGVLQFRFRGKSGVMHSIDIADRRLADAVRRCQDLPGQQLFQYVDDGGQQRALTSQEVNAYIREAGGGEFTAKDFRTWAGTLLAAQTLASEAAEQTATGRKRQIVRALDEVAARLGNTRAVCRKCYVHPAVLASYLGDGRACVRAAAGNGPRARACAERALLRFLAKVEGARTAGTAAPAARAA
jgi:DNA topoisomerase-1